MRDLTNTQILTLAKAAGLPITQNDALEIVYQVNAILQTIEPIKLPETPIIEPLPIDLVEYIDSDQQGKRDHIDTADLTDNYDTPTMSIVDLAQKIRAKEISVTEVVSLFLDRIDRLNPQLIAFTDVYRQQSLQAAAILEKEVSEGEIRGWLHGIPIGIKEQVDVEGFPTTGGSKVLENNIATTDATVVSRLKDAGGIVIGKLNMSELAIAETIEFPWGTPLNPWNTERTPGASSSGSAIAVATSMCGATIGGGTGGSIRMPAALCGTVGLRPTYGRVSRAGSLSACWSMDTLGPLTKTVMDCAVILEKIAGFDVRDRYSNKKAPLAYSGQLKYSDKRIKNLRIGVITELISPTSIDAEVIKSVQDACALFEQNGAVIHPISVPIVQDAGIIHWTICFTEFAQVNKNLLKNHLQELTHMVKIAVATGSIIPGGAYYKALQLRELFRHTMLSLFKDVDLIVAPTMSAGAQPRNQTIHTTSKEEVLEGLHGAPKLTAPFNLAGLPALSIQCGMTFENLPIGLQIVGKPFDELTVLQAGHLFESSTKWHTLTPPIF